MENRWVPAINRSWVEGWLEGESVKDVLRGDVTVLQDFPDSSVGKESACNAGDPGSVPGSGRSSGEGIDYPFQYSGLENSWTTVHGVAKSRTWLSNFYSLTQGHRILSPILIMNVQSYGQKLHRQQKGSFSPALSSSAPWTSSMMKMYDASGAFLLLGVKALLQKNISVALLSPFCLSRPSQVLSIWEHLSISGLHWPSSCSQKSSWESWGSETLTGWPSIVRKCSGFSIKCCGYWATMGKELC